MTFSLLTSRYIKWYMSRQQEGSTRNEFQTGQVYNYEIRTIIQERRWVDSFPFVEYQRYNCHWNKVMHIICNNQNVLSYSYSANFLCLETIHFDLNHEHKANKCNGRQFVILSEEKQDLYILICCPLYPLHGIYLGLLFSQISVLKHFV